MVPLPAVSVGTVMLKLPLLVVAKLLSSNSSGFSNQKTLRRTAEIKVRLAFSILNLTDYTERYTGGDRA